MHRESATLVCFAVKEESKFFKPLAGHRPNIEILLTGMGASNAANALRTRLTHTPPGLVVSSGFAGGLKPGLTTGSILFSSRQNGTLEQALVKAGAQPGRFCLADRIVTSVQDKKHLRETTGADAVEMESQVICTLCQEREIPCVTVRVVLDTAEEDLPLDFNQLLTADDRMDFRKLALALLKQPGKIPALLRLGKQTGLAAKQLGEVLARALVN